MSRTVKTSKSPSLFELGRRTLLVSGYLASVSLVLAEPPANTVAAFGRVVDVDEAPIGGAEVSFFSTDRQKPPEPLDQILEQPLLRVQSGEDGLFFVDDMAAGRYDVVVRAPGFAPLAIPGLPFDPLANENDAAPVRVDLGTAMLGPGVDLNGKVVDPRGRGLAGAEVEARRGLAWLDVTTVTSRDGRFTIRDLGPGEEVVLIARHAGHGPATAVLEALDREAQDAESTDMVELVLPFAASISGRIIDSGGVGLGEARLEIEHLDRAGSIGEAAVKSEADGEFRLAGLSPGTYSLRARAADHLPAELHSVSVDPGEELTEVEIVLQRGAVIEGRVFLPDGGPAPDSLISATPLAARSPQAPGPGSAAGAADAAGRYRIAGLPPGRHRIVASHPDHGSVAHTIDLIQGGSAAFDLTFKAGWSLAGRAVDEAERPVAEARLRLVASDGEAAVRAVVSGADGTFLFRNVSAGRYDLLAEAAGFAPPPARSLTVHGGPPADVEVGFGRGGAIAGRVLGVPPEVLGQVEIQARRAAGGSAEVRVGVDGEYRLENLAHGDWWVRASIPREGQAVDRQVYLPAGEPETALDLEFSVGVSLNGRVFFAGQAVSGARLLLLGERTTLHGSTDAGGAFRFAGLEPGPYSLEVSGTRHGFRHHRELELASDHQIVVELPRASLSGRVTDSGGAVLAGRDIVLRAADDLELPRRTVSDARGFFSFAGLTPGSYELTAGRSGDVEARIRVEVEHGAAEIVIVIDQRDETAPRASELDEGTANVSDSPAADR